METILIDEKEVNTKLVERVQTLNANLITRMREKTIEMGINPNSYVGGISTSITTNNLCLESNINNLIAAYGNNFNESIFFQLDNIKRMRSIELIQQYLSEKNLLEDFIIYRDRNKGHIWSGGVPGFKG